MPDKLEKNMYVRQYEGLKAVTNCQNSKTLVTFKKIAMRKFYYLQIGLHILGMTSQITAINLTVLNVQTLRGKNQTD